MMESYLVEVVDGKIIPSNKNVPIPEVSSITDGLYYVDQFLIGDDEANIRGSTNDTSAFFQMQKKIEKAPDLYDALFSRMTAGWVAILMPCAWGHRTGSASI
jgi:hypothetical protein